MVPPSGRSRPRREAPGGLVPVPAVRAGEFHTAHKLTREAGPLVPAWRHGPKHYAERGRLMTDVGNRDSDEVTAAYGAMLMVGLSVMGRLDLLRLIEDRRQGLAQQHRMITAEAAERLLPRRVPLARGPEPLPGARLGACAERSVGTSASVLTSVPEGAHAAESRVGSAEDRRNDLHGRRKSARWLPSKSA